VHRERKKMSEEEERERKREIFEREDLEKEERNYD
jgi:hypothetical protein